MRNFTVLVCLLLSFSIFAKEKDKQPLQPSIFEVTPVNSPVKGSTAKFSLNLPRGFEVDKVKVKLVNANDLNKDQKNFEDIKIVNNNELNVGVSKLPPGFYRLYIKVWDKKNKGEHDFKKKYHDFVRFVIDESLQVPMPDPKKNNATIGGIDSDKDGIRDDIQRWINETYLNSGNGFYALKQMAAGFQLSLLKTQTTKEESIAASKTFLDSVLCLKESRPQDHRVLRNELKARFLNTRERIKADFLAEKNFHGQGGSLPQDNRITCEFNFQR